MSKPVETTWTVLDEQNINRTQLSQSQISASQISATNEIRRLLRGGQQDLNSGMFVVSAILPFDQQNNQNNDAASVIAQALNETPSWQRERPSRRRNQGTRMKELFKALSSAMPTVAALLGVQAPMAALQTQNDPGQSSWLLLSISAIFLVFWPLWLVFGVVLWPFGLLVGLNAWLFASGMYLLYAQTDRPIQDGSWFRRLPFLPFNPKRVFLVDIAALSYAKSLLTGPIWLAARWTWWRLSSAVRGEGVARLNGKRLKVCQDIAYSPYHALDVYCADPRYPLRADRTDYPGGSDIWSEGWTSGDESDMPDERKESSRRRHAETSQLTDEDKTSDSPRLAQRRMLLPSKLTQSSLSNPSVMTTMKPVILLVHGGMWRSGDKRLFVPLAERLSHRRGPGIRLNSTGSRAVVVAPNLTLYPRGKLHHQLHDLHAALLWTHDNIRKFGGDPSRIHIVASGDSGSHLVALLVLLDAAGRLRRQVGGGNGLNQLATMIEQLGPQPGCNRAWINPPSPPRHLLPALLSSGSKVEPLPRICSVTLACGVYDPHGQWIHDKSRGLEQIGAMTRILGMRREAEIEAQWRSGVQREGDFSEFGLDSTWDELWTSPTRLLAHLDAVFKACSRVNSAIGTGLLNRSSFTVAPGSPPRGRSAAPNSPLASPGLGKSNVDLNSVNRDLLRTNLPARWHLLHGGDDDVVLPNQSVQFSQGLREGLGYSTSSARLTVFDAFEDEEEEDLRRRGTRVDRVGHLDLIASMLFPGSGTVSDYIVDSVESEL
jgi:acetyl esterase/lipase